MKNFIEKVKTNKLRSALIGLSVFLFGFIAVNIFNNINNSYATSLNDYTCSTSGYEIVQDSDGNYPREIFD